MVGAFWIVYEFKEGAVSMDSKLPKITVKNKQKFSEFYLKNKDI